MSNEPPTEQPSPVNMTEAPPQTIGGILRRLGPGLVLAGSIVGSGELIATTITGAQAGIWLLWLIIVGCVIKVFVQVELGRYAITSGKTALTALNEVPGPSFGGRWGRHEVRGNWLIWFWAIMFLASMGQLGGIVGGVGQALAISLPLTKEGRAYNAQLDAKVKHQAKTAQLKLELANGNTEQADELKAELDGLKPRVEAYNHLIATHQQYNEKKAQLDRYQAAVDDDDEGEDAEEALATIAVLKQDVQILADEKEAAGPLLEPLDHKYWAVIVAAVTAVLLFWGRYGFIERFVMIMVGSFTVVTIANVVALQFHESWAISFGDIIDGLSFHAAQLSVSQKLAGAKPLTTALMTFGIIGVGASELVAYPYWCLEKGYGRFTGPHDESPEWAERAKGWLRVMRWDAWCSMVIYTIATVAFYLLGAAVLNRTGLQPAKSEMVRMLAVMYEPVFGAIAGTLFLFGAFAVLYSTFFCANAAQTRMATDVVNVVGLTNMSEKGRRWSIRILGILFPAACAAVYWIYPNPVTLVFISGTMQALMLPMLGVAAIYFRYTRCDKRLKPNLLWDLGLWVSFLGLLVAGVYLAYDKVFG
ncbi:MAG: Nramp family divalent metal transporter [Planctomycetes bacterium]|nr:Nramp family divalent metal transporter [Planctomycetota bacterium]